MLARTPRHEHERNDSRMQVRSNRDVVELRILSSAFPEWILRLSHAIAHELAKLLLQITERH